MGILTLLILLLWISSLIFFDNLADTSTNIIRKNSRSITYMENIQQTMKEFYLLQSSILSNEELALTPSALKIDSLRTNVLSQSAKALRNVSEPEEGKTAKNLREAILAYLGQFHQLMNHPGFNRKTYRALAQQYALVQYLSGKIISANIVRMAQKNKQAQNNTTTILSYIMLIGIVSTILAIFLLVGYPNYIIKSIDRLTVQINKIAKYNFRPRLRIEKGEEFEELAVSFNAMAVSLQEYETSNLAKIKNEKQRIEAIINHMNEAVLGLDRNKNILFVNAKAEELIGLDYKAMSGRYAPDIATGNKLMRMLIRDLMSGEHSGSEEKNTDFLEVAAKDQKLFYSKETIPVISTTDKGNNHRQIGFIIILKNVTRFQEMDEAKTNFIAVASHELKTPISSIKMGLRLLKDERVGELNDEQKRLVNNIENDAMRMKTSTDDLLDLSKIETGNIHINLQQAEPVALIERAYETMKLQAKQKDVSIEIELHDELPKVNADIQKTMWVFVNLIANAIRHTPPRGLIKLNANKVNGTVKFAVTDTGKGIPLKYQDKIFDKYFQVQNGHSGDEGTGLGLAIAREFINAQGGEIGVESEIGKGSCFYFTIPVVLKN